MPQQFPHADFPAAVIFDFDGVILESVQVKTEAFRALFAGYPQHVPDIVRLHEELGGISRNVKFERIYRDILKEPLHDDLRQQLAQRFERIVFERVLACPFVLGAPEILERLSPRIPLFIASGTPDAELKEIVSRRNIAALFREAHGSPREKEDIIGDVLSRHGLAPERVIMVGDAKTDYAAASATGCRFIGRVPQGAESPFPAGTCLVDDLRPLERAFTMLYSEGFRPEGRLS